MNTICLRCILNQIVYTTSLLNDSFSYKCEYKSSTCVLVYRYYCIQNIKGIAYQKLMFVPTHSLNPVQQTSIVSLSVCPLENRIDLTDLTISSLLYVHCGGFTHIFYRENVGVWLQVMLSDTAFIATSNIHVHVMLNRLPVTQYMFLIYTH